MTDLRETSELEQVYFEIRRIRTDLDRLEEFLISKMADQHPKKPNSEGLIDPRTSQRFRKRSKEREQQ